MSVQPILIIHPFHTCEFTSTNQYSAVLLRIFVDMNRVVKNLSHLSMFSAVIKQGDALPYCFTSQRANNYPFCSTCSVLCFLHFCAFWWWFWCLKWPPSMGLKCFLMLLSKKAVMSLMQKMYVLGKLPPGMGCSAIGCEFNVNGSTVIMK